MNDIDISAAVYCIASRHSLRVKKGLLCWRRGDWSLVSPDAVHAVIYGW